MMIIHTAGFLKTKDSIYKMVADEVYLKFLCEVFHPAVRYDKGYWKEFLVAINKLLQNDGYEIYPAEKISNRDVYGWRIYQQEDNTLFIPYSQRMQRT